MPYVRDDSASPVRRHLSLSPDGDDKAGPSKKPKVTTTDIRRKQLEKLFENPEKEVTLPTGTRERTVRAPQEMMKNVQGSSAGAGSGEFHVYKQARRREYERLKIMSDKTRALEEQAAFQARQAERDAIADTKTAKNRAKRQKRKHGKKSENGKDSADVPGGEKRKLAGGGVGVLFKRPGEEDESEESEAEQVGLTLSMTAAEEMIEPPSVAQEAPIVIHDD